MNHRQPGTKAGPSANSPKQKKQHALAWTLHQVMGAQGNLKVWAYRDVMPAHIWEDVNNISAKLALLEIEIRNELRSIK